MALATSFAGAGVLSSRQCSFQGSQRGLQVSRGEAAVVMRKKDIHPKWFEEAKVLCNGEEVLVTSGTQPQYVVDIWSGNHPFYQGLGTSVVTDEGRVNRFKRRFAGLDSLAAVQTMSNMTGAAPQKLEYEAPTAKAKGKGKKK